MNGFRSIFVTLVCIGLATASYAQAPVEAPAPVAPVETIPADPLATPVVTTPEAVPEVVTPLAPDAMAPAVEIPVEAVQPAAEAAPESISLEDAMADMGDTTGTATTTGTTTIEIGIAEAAGTLTDPMAFIYVSQEFVFNLLVLTSYVEPNGTVDFDPDLLPTIEAPAGSLSASGDGIQTSYLGGGSSPAGGYGSGAYGGGYGSGYYGAGSSPVPAGSSAVEGGEYLSGLQQPGQGGAEEIEGDKEWLRAVTVNSDPELEKLLKMVEKLPEWRRVARLPLPLTEKRKLDERIVTIYRAAYIQAVPQAAPGTANYYQYQQPYAAPYQTYGQQPGAAPYGTGGYGDVGYGGPSTYIAPQPEYGGSSVAVQPAGSSVAVQPYGAPGYPQTVPVGSSAVPNYYGTYGTAGGLQPGVAPADPTTMGQWYWYYQQLLGWERYIAQSTLQMTNNEDEVQYELESSLNTQDLYLVPQQGATPIIHFDGEESATSQYLSTVRPGSLDMATAQMHGVMEQLAEEKAKEDSERSREFVARLNERKERRFRYREWQNDQSNEIRKIADDYRRRLAGDELVIDDMRVLVSPEPLNHVPLNARNIVTERLTPYDLIDPNGAIKRPAEERLDVDTAP